MKEKLEVAETVLKIIALLAALVWFVLQGEALTRGNVSQDVSKTQFDDFFNLLNVNVSVQNCGKLPLEIKKVFITVYEVSPLEGTSKRSGKRRFTNTLRDFATFNSYTTTKTISWPYLIRYKTNPCCFIRQGEREVLNYQLLVPRTKEILKVQTYVERGKAGWLERWLPLFPGMAEKSMGWYADTLLNMRRVNYE